MNDIDLGNKKKIEIVNVFLFVKYLNVDCVLEMIFFLERERVEVLVFFMVFGVDNGELEWVVYEVVLVKLIFIMMVFDIIKLYGLIRRIWIVVINVFILFKMLDMVILIEDFVWEVGVNVFLMIMCGDGGVMEINEMKKWFVLIMFFGLVVLVMGFLMYLRVFNGVYFEVGGIIINIGVIKNGCLVIDYLIVGGYLIYIFLLDVWVLGVVGGLMVWVN